MRGVREEEKAYGKDKVLRFGFTDFDLKAADFVYDIDIKMFYAIM